VDDKSPGGWGGANSVTVAPCTLCERPMTGADGGWGRGRVGADGADEGHVAEEDGVDDRRPLIEVVEGDPWGAGAVV